MSKVTIYILVLLNLVLVLYSAHFFLVEGGFSWKQWLAEEDVAVFPMALFLIALISRKMFLVNLSLPFLVLYGPVYFLYGKEVSSGLFALLQLVLMTVDIVYVLIGDFNLRCWKYFIWGLIVGGLALLIYHRLQFGRSLNLQLPILRLFGHFTDYMAKFADSQGG